jgi:replicative DNA helicase
MNNTLQKLDKEIKNIEDEEKRHEANERLKAIARVYEGEDEVVSWDEIAQESRKESVKIMSGWAGLDDLLKGFRPQQLIVVSAATKSGKTSLMVDLTCRLKEHSPLWFPFEESAEELTAKFLERGETPPEAFSPKSMLTGTTKWIEDKIVESIAKYGTKVIIIDHLDFIVPFNADNHSLRVAQAMRDMKGLAKKWNVVIFLICHLVKTKMDSQPTLEDLRGSASIAQEADTVILLWRETKRVGGQVEITNNMNVSVQANRRHGKTGNVKMVFQNGKFLEEDWTQSDAEKEFNKF